MSRYLTTPARLDDVTVVLDNVRSLYNVGAVMRACDAAGVLHLVAGGVTPYPDLGAADPRRRPVAARASRELRKTALAATQTVRVEPAPSVAKAVERLRAAGITIVAIERAPGARLLWESSALDAAPLALVFGHEVEGIGPEVLRLADAVVEIPMLGAGSSLNVAVAAGIVLYEVLRRRLARSSGSNRQAP